MAEKEEGPGTAISITTQVDGVTHMVLQTSMLRDAPTAEYHKMVAKLSRVVEMVAWKGQLAGMRNDVINCENSLKDAIEKHDSVDAKYADAWIKRGKKGEPVGGVKQDAEKHNFEQNIKGAKAALEKSRAMLKELEDKIAAEFVGE